MKSRTRTSALAVLLALTIPTGCSMSDDKADDDIPFAGTSTSRAAADSMKEVSSGLYELIGVKGKASDGRPGVMDCSGKDTKTHFRIFHPWSFYPASASDLDRAMEHLKEELPKHGWEIVAYGPDNSRNRNIKMIADHDRRRVGVNVVMRAKNDPPKLSVTLVSGCYKVPGGEEVDRF